MFGEFSHLALLERSTRCSLPASSQQPQKQADCDHHAAENLAHGERAQYESYLLIRLTDELDEKSEDPVAHKKQRQHGAVGPVDRGWTGFAL